MPAHKTDRGGFLEDSDPGPGEQPLVLLRGPARMPPLRLRAYLEPRHRLGARGATFHTCRHSRRVRGHLRDEECDTVRKLHRRGNTGEFLLGTNVLQQTLAEHLLCAQPDAGLGNGVQPWARPDLPRSVPSRGGTGDEIGVNSYEPVC